MVLSDIPPAQISENFEHFWSFVVFWSKNRFSSSTRSTPRATLKMGKSVGKKLSIFGFFMPKYTFSAISKRFHQVLSLQNVKKHAKNDLLLLFGHTGSSLGRLQFGRGKWTPN